MITKTEAGERDFSVQYLRHGIPEAFKVFFFEYYSELFSFSQMLLHDRVAARRITMEAFFLLWDKRSGFDSAKTIKAFLYLTVRNKCLCYLKASGDASQDEEVIPASLPPELLRQLFAFAATTV